MGNGNIKTTTFNPKKTTTFNPKKTTFKPIENMVTDSLEAIPDALVVEKYEDFGEAVDLASTYPNIFVNDSELVVERLRLYDNPNMKNKEGRTPLMHVIYSNHSQKLKIVTALLCSPLTNVNEARKDYLKPTALHYACSTEHGDVEVVKLLLQRPDLDVNIQTKNGFTPLHYAAMSGQVAIVKILIKDKRLDPNIKNSKGDTAMLHRLRHQKHSEKIVRALLHHPRIDPNVQNEDGNAAIHLADLQNDKLSVVALMKHGNVDTELENSMGVKVKSSSHENPMSNFIRKTLSKAVK